MENNMEVPENLAKTPRVARCLTCSNEWMARDGSKKKPARCPECLSRNVAWRDECESKSDELTKEPVPEVEIREEEEELVSHMTVDEGTHTETVSLESIAKNTPKINPIGFVFVIGALAAAGIAFFLIRERKRRSKKHSGNGQEQAEIVKQPGEYHPTRLYGGIV